MNTTLLLNRAGKEVERAKTQVAVDAKAARLAHELARAAKVNLKQARKLSKMARKSARKAKNRAEESSATLETAQAKVEMLRERIRNEQRKNNPSPKSKPGKTTMDTTPRVSPFQSLRSTKPAARKADGARRSAQKTVNGKPAKLAPMVAPEPKPVIGAPTFSDQEPAND
jgi:hypothetical protein